jgi:hypothetical protein
MILNVTAYVCCEIHYKFLNSTSGLISIPHIP